MLAYADEEALRRTRETGEAWFWSRSRNELWHKGATSGNTMAVEEIADDCDGDALLYRVRPSGPACHTGAESCFAPWLWRIVAERAATRPAGSYVAGLLDGGPAAAARKVGEEGVEAALAAVARVATSGSSRSSPTSGSTATSCSPPAACSRRRSRTSSGAHAHADGRRIAVSKTIVVTGGSRGIGRAVALRRRLAGLVGRRRLPGGSLRPRRRWSPRSRRPAGVPSRHAGDVAVEADVVALFDATEEAFGRLDGAVVNAGITAPPLPLVET